jgi:hypothetical protein
MGNCVGYHNIKPFFLYCLFTFIAFCNYVVVLIDRECISKENKNSFTSLGSFCFWVSNIIEIPMCIPLMSFSFNYFLQKYINFGFLGALSTISFLPWAISNYYLAILVYIIYGYGFDASFICQLLEDILVRLGLS